MLAAFDSPAMISVLLFYFTLFLIIIIEVLLNSVVLL